MSDKSSQLIGRSLRRIGEFYRDFLNSYLLGDFRQIPAKRINFHRFQSDSIGQNLNQDHGNIFRQDPKPTCLQTHEHL